MRAIFHLLTRQNDPLAEEMINLQKATPGLEVQVLDLTAEEPDYSKALEAIFRADSVQVW